MRLITDRPGRRTAIHYEDGRPIILMQQDADPLTHYAHEVARDLPARPVGGAGWRQIGHLPAVIYHDLLLRFGPPNKNPSDWRRWWNDPENRAFRVDPRRV